MGTLGSWENLPLNKGSSTALRKKLRVSEKGIGFETEHKSTRSEKGSFSSVWDRPKCWTRVKWDSVILQRFLPGGSIVLNYSKASSGTVVK